DEYRETLHPGIFACGNVLQVHDLVDYVTEESQIAGKGAADYIFGKKKGGTFINTKGINGVRYIVPQRVNIEGEENLKLYFRVGQVYKGAKVVVECDGKILSSKKKVKLAPGEMENVTITTEMLKDMNKDSEIIVRVEE
ncbi:MAG: pyridine nucleotide-disulfide oxidoreductase, partial [Clostridia bacterium]|nr:pyridine nucleotide-disulfide oxidoreductase [Clostridia bacterium]